MSMTFGPVLHASQEIVGPLMLLSHDNMDGCANYSIADATNAASAVLLLSNSTTCTLTEQAMRANSHGVVAVILATAMTQVMEGSWVIGGLMDDVAVPTFGMSISELSVLMDLLRGHPQSLCSIRRPLSDDLVNDLAAFSSRGPASQMRIKPDVVAPGEAIFSAMAHSGCHVVPSQGTSMATPVVASAMALLREYLVAGYYPTGRINATNAMATPSGALLKAMVIHSARRMPGGTSDGTVDLRTERFPFIYQGHGRVNISNVLYFDDQDEGIHPIINPLQLYDRRNHSIGRCARVRIACHGGTGIGRDHGLYGWCFTCFW